MSRTLVVRDTSNAKTGRMAATYRTSGTCPSTCPLRESGCYARGRIFGIPSRLGSEDDGQYRAVRDLAGSVPAGGMIRANVSGDVLSDDGAPDRAYLSALSDVARARPDVGVYGYTHAWRTLGQGDAGGAILNASCESRTDLETAIAAGWPTVVTATDPGDPIIGSTIGGRRVVVCPAQSREGITCATCRLCARASRRSTVAFIVHGSGAKRAAAAIRSTREA